MMSAHGLENSLNTEYLAPDFLAALEKAWCRDTCWDGCAGRYPANREDNPAFGNCLVSVLAAWGQRGFKDGIIPGLVFEPGNDQPIWHFRLAIDQGPGRNPVIIDPTWQQFEEGALCIMLGTSHDMYETVIHDSVFAEPEASRLSQRLALLSRRMEETGYRMPASTDQIMDRLKEEFACLANRAAPVKGPAPHIHPH